MAEINARLTKVRARLDELEIDAFLISQPHNRRYVSGFTGSTATLLVSRHHALIATDSRYWEQARLQAPEFELAQVKTRLADHLGEMFDRAGGARRIGFESAAVCVDELAQWREACPAVEWIAAKDVVEPIRMVKDAGELTAIRRAAAVADAGFDFLCGILAPGMTEREAAWQIEVYLRTHGAEALAFETIVASGPNGAMAHHQPGSRVIQRGEPIVIDFGVVVDGYCSDMTRTVSLGDGDPRYSEVYGVVRRAQQAALDGIRAGMLGEQADALARDVIVAAGYGESFGHGLGHGVGLAVHEAPRAGRVSAQNVLVSGATLTVEPGVYLPGWGGVRIEDLTVIGEDGLDVVSRAHKNPVI